jgi:hypothetical protein
VTDQMLLDRVRFLERENSQLRQENVTLRGSVKVAENAIEVAIEGLSAADGSIPEMN